MRVTLCELCKGQIDETERGLRVKFKRTGSYDISCMKPKVDWS